LKTASFFSYTGPGRVSIARYPPRGTPAGFRVFKALAPGAWFNSVTREEYERLYAEQLSKLDPAQTKADLEKLAGGAEPVLLCYEKPPFTDTNWCHRRLAAEWFERELGIQVPEHEDRPEAQPQQQDLLTGT
jgi:hypothetical protein